MGASLKELARVVLSLFVGVEEVFRSGEGSRFEF